MNVQFFELYESEVLASSSLAAGSFICCKDSTNMYMVPTTGGKAVKMAETTKFLSDTERRNILAPINGKKYFCYDTGKMWIYYNNWICINPDAAPSEYDIENVVLTKTGSVRVNDSRITAKNTGVFTPDLSVNDLVSNINVTCAAGYATITGTTSYDIPGTLKIK